MTATPEMNSKPESFQTSREAYEHCVESGLISKRVAEVLEVLVEDGPMNQTMAHQAIVRRTGIMGLEKYSISPRFATLERMGLIRVVGKQPCPVTRRPTVYYEATNLPPKCTEAQANDARERRSTIKSLEARCAELEADKKQLTELLNLKSGSFHERERRIKNTPLAIQTSFL